MPIYEYRCNRCNRRSSHFFRSFADARTPACPYCASADLRRVMSTFAVHIPWDSGTDIPSSETLGDFDDDDPKSMAEWAKGMRKDMGPSFGREMDEFVEEMEASSAEPLGDHGDDAES
ncbi:MAG: zinc ribbon domain-containing protein [Chloroflexi bacterium]|nr:zinc ribbon domain-containing protein [Chloroflexota bacterium]